MTDEELIEELESCARQSEDAATFNELGATRFEAEYHRSLDERPSARALELYAYVVQGRRQATRLRREAALFRTAAERIGDRGRTNDG